MSLSLLWSTMLWSTASAARTHLALGRGVLLPAAPRCRRMVLPPTMRGGGKRAAKERGEVLAKPGKAVAEPPPEPTNFLRNIIRQDLSSGKHDSIVTRFPPEPNGYLHMGHAQSMNMNFALAFAKLEEAGVAIPKKETVFRCAAPRP